MPSSPDRCSSSTGGAPCESVGQASSLPLGSVTSDAGCATASAASCVLPSAGHCHDGDSPYPPPPPQSTPDNSLFPQAKGDCRRPGVPGKRNLPISLVF